MLLDSIRALFGQNKSASTTPDAAPSANAPDAVEPVALAACVLLLDLAHADGEFSDTERAHFESAMQRHFDIPLESVRALVEEAERERTAAVDYFRFTSQIMREYDLGQKMVLAEVMWGLVLADGEVSDHEHYLTRKISNLLDLEPGYLSAAKEKATSRAAKRVD